MLWQVSKLTEVKHKHKLNNNVFSLAVLSWKMIPLMHILKNWSLLQAKTINDPQAPRLQINFRVQNPNIVSMDGHKCCKLMRFMTGLWVIIILSAPTRQLHRLIVYCVMGLSRKYCVSQGSSVLALTWERRQRILDVLAIKSETCCILLSDRPQLLLMTAVSTTVFGLYAV